MTEAHEDPKFEPLEGFDDEEPEGDAPAEGNEAAPEEPPADDDSSAESGEPSGDDAPAGDEPPAEEEPPPFEFKAEGKPQPSPEAKDEELTEIIHNGQVYKLTKQELVALAQKGFDYGKKLGPHKKLVELIEADPGVSKVVNDYIQGKIKTQEEFKPLPLSEFDSEEAWLQANIKKAMEELSPPPPQQPQQPQQPQVNPAESIAQGLLGRDPDYFHEVAPHLEAYARQLPYDQYMHLQNPANIADIYRFYDKVKEHMMQSGKLKQRENAPVPRQEPPRFQPKPGGGKPPAKPSTENVAWELPNEEFQKILAKARGF